jgi:glycine/D-amino acid oxidase-like deaminating enzyme
MKYTLPAMPDPTLASLWAATAPAGPDCPALAGEVRTRVAVVGAGLAGLSAALALAERGVPAVVLEAGAPGEGGSGASGGQVIGGLRHLPEDLTAALGEAAGQKAYRFGTTTAEAAFALIDRHELECDARQSGWINPVDTEADLRLAERRVAAWRDAGGPARMLDAAETRARLGTAAYVAAWVHERSGTVQPLMLTRALARRVLALGGTIHGGSAVRRIASAPGGWRLETEAGAVTAGRVLVATGGRCGLLPPVARQVLPVWSFQAATAKLPPDLAARILPGAEAASDNRRILRYWRRDRDGRLVVGGKGTLRAPRAAAQFGVVHRILADLYPQARGVPVTHRWGGIVAVTRDRLPRLVQAAPGLVATLGCNGKGIAWNLALGAPLAEYLDGGDPAVLPLPLTPPAPIPLHRMKRAHVALGSLWLRLRDAMEHRIVGRTG